MFTPIGSNHVFIGGDLSSRISNMDVGKEHLCMKYTRNIDSVINSHGQELWKICKSFSCFVVNNHEVGSKVYDGGYTFYQHDRKSQNYILLANKMDITSITDFTIHRIGWNPSDHLPISTNVALCLQKENFGKHASNDILSDQTKWDTIMPKKMNLVLINWD